MSNTLLIIMLLISFNKMELEEKSESLNIYLKKIHNIKLDKNKTYHFLCIITPSCSPCYNHSIDKSKDFLNRDSTNFVIFSGKLLEIPKKLLSIQNANLIIDLDNHYYKYDIFPFTNVILTIKQNKIVEVIEVVPTTKI